MSDHVDDHVLLSDSEIGALYRHGHGNGFAITGEFNTLFDAAEKIGLTSVETFDDGAVDGVVGFNEHREILAIGEYESDGPWAVNITAAKESLTEENLEKLD
jgi:hypothetical protein